MPIFILLILFLMVPCFSYAASVSGSGGSSSSPSGLDQNFDVTNGNIITGSSEAKKFKIFGIGGQSTKAVVLYVHSDGSYRVACENNGVEGDCDKGVSLNAGKIFNIFDSTGNPILTVNESSGSTTNMFLDAEGPNNDIVIKRYRFLSAGVCNGATPSASWELPVSNPAVSNCRTGTNTTKAVLEFADGANALTAQWNEYLHEDWTGVIDATIIWESGSTSTNNVVWQLAIACAGDGVSDDPAFTDTVFAADANKGTANQYNLTAATTITTTGSCAANKMMHIRLKRDPAHASDTLAATAQAVGVSLKLREGQ